MSSITVGRTGSETPTRPRLRDRVRRFAEAAVTPLEISDVLDVFHPLRSGAQLRGKIVAVVPETAESATIVIKPGRDWAGHVPGQYVRVGVDVDGVRLWRTYSLTHGPRPDRCISLTVKAIPDGVVSHHLVHRARAGQMIQLEQAEGEFVLPQPIPDKLLLVTAGSGITPVIGMLRNLFSRSKPVATDIVMVHVNPTESAALFREELRLLGATGRIRLIERYDDRDGLLEVAQIDELVPDLPERLSYACGPAGLLDALEEHHDRPRARADHRAVPADGDRGVRRGRHALLRLGRGRGGRRRHPDPGRRRGRGRADAQRLPDGHLHGLRAAAEGGRRPRPPQRRAHRRRTRRDRPRRRTHPDLHQRRCRRLHHRPLTT